jgi:hypothetical protein
VNAATRCQQRVDRQARQQESDGGADEREHAALGDQLPQQPPAAGTQRRPHGNLAATRFRARDHQVGDVRARDEQDEGDRRHQHQQRRPQPADELDVERADFDTALFIRLDERLGSRAVHLGLRAGQADASFNPPVKPRLPRCASACRRLNATAPTAPRNPSGMNPGGRIRSPRRVFHVIVCR